MNAKVQQALSKKFEASRIVFWNDVKCELRNDYEALELDGVTKIELKSNEFGVKYRILRESPEQKFLLYREGPPPEDLENWLLDVELAYAEGEFRTDQVAIWLTELGLNYIYAPVVEAHADFFKSGKRLASLKHLLKPEDSEGLIRLKMLAVCAGSEPRLDSALEQLLQELANDKDSKIKLIERSGLTTFLWEQLDRYYGYSSEAAGVRDFVIELFKSCFAMGTEGTVRLNSDALVFLKRWKDSRQFESCFETLSSQCADVLTIESAIGERDFRDLIELDYFRLIDQKIIASIVRGIVDRTVTSGDVTLWVRQRRQGHWYAEFAALYESLELAAHFIETLGTVSLDMQSMDEGFEKYTSSWFKIDQLYRRFIYQVQVSGQTSLLGELSEQIENLYSNNYLLPMNDRWQFFVDKTETWDFPAKQMQRKFYKEKITTSKDKVCVIISDALRFEVGEALSGAIRSANKYEVQLGSAISSVPSYTQLGMASLLPHTTLEIADNDSGLVLIDGQSTRGLEARAKRLKAAEPESIAVQADEVLNYSRDEIRDLCRNHQLIYIYHNIIDATGDDSKTEGSVFKATQTAIEDLSRLVTKIGGENYIANFIVTADHGFIYQNKKIEESDYSSEEAQGDQILYRDRRFVLGKGLHSSGGLKKFTAAQLGLAGTVEALIPKSINRLRLQGSGSRFVHGGTSLQEVVIPMVHINKKRPTDTSEVKVEILRSSNNVITSGQVAVTLYQSAPVTDKVQAITRRIGIYTKDEKLISDEHELTFDFTSENPRDRELKVRLVLSREADDYNQKEVYLKLKGKHKDTSHDEDHGSLPYIIRRSFTSDFDF
jgi:uncharacterized protein (TIGR02687 family)